MNIGVGQPQLDIFEEISSYTDFRKTAKADLSLLMPSGDIKFDATVGKNNDTKINKLIDKPDVPVVSTERKSTTQNLGFLGIEK